MKNEIRNEKILKLYNAWKWRQEIKEILRLTSDFDLELSVIDNVIRLYKNDSKTEEYDENRIKALERSKQRLQDENSLLRRQVRNVNRTETNYRTIKDFFTELVEENIDKINVPTKEVKSEDWKYFSTTDWHLWKQNTKKILKKIWKIKEEVLRCEEENITFAMLWDLWENLSQVPMHSWQHLHMEVLELKDNIRLAIKVFSDLIESVTPTKKLELVLIWWNHDRLTSKNEDDYLRSWMFMINEILEAKYADNKNLTLVYNTKNRVILEKRHIVLDLGHWEFNFNKDKLETIRQKTWLNTTKHIIRNSWHRHTASLSNARDITRVITPALAWEWDYDWRLDLSSNSWYTVISIKDKAPRIETIFFYN